jgi:endonuclease/exonuclease/phosphatase family metal-dependent hydrolase
MSTFASQAGMVEVLREADLHIAALQELYIPPNGDLTELRSIAWNAGFPYVEVERLSPSAKRQGSGFMGVGLFSRHPLHDVSLTPLNNPGFAITRGGQDFSCHDKGMLSARIEYDGLSLWVASLHAVPFDFFEKRDDDEAHRHLWENMAEAVQSIGDGHMILAGDFNSERRELLTDKLAKRSERIFASAVGRVPTTDAGKAFDDILFSGPFKADRVRTEPTFSDHRLCIAEFVVLDDP